MKRKNMMYLIFFASLIVVFIFLQKSIKKDEQNLLMTGKLAIGIFEDFGYSYKAGGYNYKYSYYNEYEGRTRNMTDGVRMNTQPKTLKAGDQFLVLYNEDGEGIFFNYPIKDSTDFKRYVREFEEMRKQKK